MSLKEYQSQDWEKTLELLKQFFNYHRNLKGATPLSKNQLETILQDWSKRHTLLLYEVNSTVIGLVRLRKDGTVYWLEDIVVDATYREQGYGSKILICLEEFLLQKGQESVYVFVIPENTRAIDFYIANGFTTLNMIELRKDIKRNNCGHSRLYQGNRFRLAWQSENLK